MSNIEMKLYVKVSIRPPKVAYLHFIKISGKCFHSLNGIKVGASNEMRVVLAEKIKSHRK